LDTRKVVAKPTQGELSRFAVIENYDVSHYPWHREGGFPVPDEFRSIIGRPNLPKDANDIRGEIFQVRTGQRMVRCAYDYSDYPVISSAVLREVDVYFKCIAPISQLPPKVLRIGYFAANPPLLAKARAQTLRTPPIKKFDVYGRFGSWTDSQPIRETILGSLHNSSIRFHGGFGTVSYPAYLQELAKAQIAIHLPGQGPLSYRLVESMALGTLVVSPKLECAFPEDLIDGVHYVSVKKDAGDLIEVCQQLLRDNDRRQKIVSHAMSFFDRNFTPQSVARRILRATVH
jgi:glycosyltransferase involved in cell wall biosynthesis